MEEIPIYEPIRFWCIMSVEKRMVYFSELEKKRREEEEAKKQQMESLDFPHRRRNMILAGLFALSAMVGYALLSGLVQIEITDDDSELLDGFDDDSDDHHE